jgi:glycosyltransferase involved in cell wall biosynthesis
LSDDIFSDDEIPKFDYFSGNFFNKIIKSFRFIYSFSNRLRLAHFLYFNKPDIAHVHLFKGTLTPSIFHALKSHNIPVILTVHDYGLLCPRNTFNSNGDYKCTKCLNGSVVSCVTNRCNRNNIFYSFVNAVEFKLFKFLFDPVVYFNSIIAVSKFSYDLHCGQSDLKELMVHIYNFYPGIFHKKSINCISQDRYFLYYGRLSHEKGILTLIRAWINSKTTIPLFIVGTGPLEETISINSLGYSDIKILGFKSGEELDLLVRNAYFVVCPSEWYENNPMTIVESYSNSVPVIASNIGGLPEIVIPGKTGFLFEAGDVNDLTAKLELADEMSKSTYLNFSNFAYQFAVENFDMGIHFKQLNNLYKNTINSVSISNKN